MSNVLGRVKGLFKKSPKPRKLPPGAYPNNERNPAAPRTGANNERNPAATAPAANNERNPAAPRTGANTERNPAAPANERNPAAPVNERNPPAPVNERNPAAGGAAPVNQRNPPAAGTITKPESATDDDDDDIDDPPTLTNRNIPGQPPSRDPPMNPGQAYQGVQSENGYESNPAPPTGPTRGPPPGFPPGFGPTNPGMNNANPPANNNNNNPRGGPPGGQPLPGMPFFAPGQNAPTRGPNPTVGNDPSGPPPPLPPPISGPGNPNPPQGGLSGLPSFFRNLNGNPAAAQSGNNSPAQPRPGFPPFGNAGNRTQTPQQSSWPARTSSMRNARRDDDTASRIELDYPIENVLIDANIPAAIAVKINDVVERDRQGNSYHVHRYTYEPGSQQFSVDHHHQPGRSHSGEQNHRSGIRHIREIHHNDQNPAYNDLPPFATPARTHRHRSFSDMPLQDYVDQLVRTPGSVVVHAKDADDLRRLVNKYLANDYVPPTVPQMMPPSIASPPQISSPMPPRNTPLPMNFGANERVVYYTAQALPNDPMRAY